MITQLRMKFVTFLEVIVFGVRNNLGVCLQFLHFCGAARCVQVHVEISHYGKSCFLSVSQSVHYRVLWVAVTTARTTEGVKVTQLNSTASRGDCVPVLIIGCQYHTFQTALIMSDRSRGWCLKYFGDAYTPVRTVAARSRLQSADHGDIVIPRTWSTRFGCRSFRVCGPTIWNKLSLHLRSTDSREQFKHRLKFECPYGWRRIW